MKNYNKFKFLTIIFSVITIISILTTGCNRQLIDTTFSYKYAIIQLPNGEIVEGKVDGWKDYDDGDQLQIYIDGKGYLTDTVNAVLITE